MKKFLTVMAFAAALLFCGQRADAQGRRNGDPAQMAQRRVEQLKQTLNLSDDQVTKLTAVFKAQSEEMAKTFQGGVRPDREAMQKMQEKQNAEIKKILTADQYKIYEEQQSRMRQRGPGGPGGGPGF